MGAFFLTDDTNRIDMAVKLLDQKRLGAMTKTQCGNWILLTYQKASSTIFSNTHSDRTDFITGFGSYHYHGNFGLSALPFLLQDFRRDGSRVFADVGGHFNFVIWAKGQLYVVSDKTGYQHAFMATESGRHYFSSSMLAIADCLDEVTFGRQEALEFIAAEGTFGRRTLFESITHLKMGMVYQLSGSIIPQQYYEANDEPLTQEKLDRRLSEYFEAYRNPRCRVSCNLSGGYDTRTIAAILTNLELDFTFDTNTKVGGTLDEVVARKLAEVLNRPLTAYVKDMSQFNFLELVDRSVVEVEMARDIFRGAYSPYIFRRKTEDSDLFLGGYGGELLRALYSNEKSVASLVRNIYVLPGIKIPPHIRREYVDTLIGKFESRLESLGETDLKKGLEKIYYFEKMRFWGGARISRINQYGRIEHPLCDHLLMRHFFDVSLSQKRYGRYQKALINRFAPQLRGQEFDHEHPGRGPNIEIYKKTRLLILQLMKTHLPGQPLRAALNLVVNPRQATFSEYTSSVPTEALEHLIGCTPADLAGNSMGLSRYYSVAYLMNRYLLD